VVQNGRQAALPQQPHVRPTADTPNTGDEENPMTASMLPTSRAGGATRPAGPVRYRESDCRLPDFTALVERATVLADFPHATEVAQGVLVYDSAALQRAAADEAGREQVEGELVGALTDGPGVVVI
jgi:hypothetical protein